MHTTVHEHHTPIHRWHSIISQQIIYSKLTIFFRFYELKVHHTTRFLKVSTTTYPTNNKVNRKIRKIKSNKLIKTIRKQT